MVLAPADLLLSFAGEALRGDEGADPKKPALEVEDLLAGGLLLAGEVVRGEAGAEPKKPPDEGLAPADLEAGGLLLFAGVELRGEAEADPKKPPEFEEDDLAGGLLLAGEELRGEAGAEPKKPPDDGLPPADLSAGGLSLAGGVLVVAAGSYCPKKLLEARLAGGGEVARELPPADLLAAGHSQN